MAFLEADADFAAVVDVANEAALLFFLSTLILLWWILTVVKLEVVETVAVVLAEEVTLPLQLVICLGEMVS